MKRLQLIRLASTFFCGFLGAALGKPAGRAECTHLLAEADVYTELGCERPRSTPPAPGLLETVTNSNL